MHGFTYGTAVAGLYLLASSLLPRIVHAATCYSTLSKSDFPNCQLLDPRYALHWNVKDGEITFGATVDVDNAWFALGISENGGMRGADITIISAVNGTLRATDCWAETYGPPQIDQQQNVQLDTSKTSRGNGVTTAVWKRPLDTCDAQDQPIVANISQAVIWAIGTSDVVTKHEDHNRGDVRIAFVPDTTAVKPKDPEDLAMVEMYFDNYAVPTNQSTSYTCIHTAFTAPKQKNGGGNTPKKFHVIRYEAVAKNEEVHHMIIYGCNSKPKDFNKTYDCLSMVDCNTFLFGYAPGQGVIEMPPEAGFAIGSAADAFEYFALQIHYTNPQSKPIIDSSGFKIWYTAHLRQYDMGVLFLGNQDIKIPGNTDIVTLPGGECPSNCTKRFPHPITVQGNFFHMHTLGRNMTTRHIRDGRELEPLGVRQYYDFNHQGLTYPINGPRLILPGDSLITTCSYTSLSRPNDTFWGEGTDSEMCYNIIQYYPRVMDVDFCVGEKGGYSSCGNLVELVEVETELAGRNVSEEGRNQGLMDAGLLVKSDIGNFTPYAPNCTPTKDSKQSFNSAGVVALAPRAAGLFALGSLISVMFIVA
ncbi:hypothetical protein HK104_002963 [Borealophlyctis nickersoniae]|nr:hypothetical protein HK104_002963 [Borealophlyctis nickersoniae]